MLKKSTFSTIISVIACPICFPKLAIIGSLLGLNFLAEYEIYFYYAFHIFVIYVFYVQVMHYLNYKNKPLLVLSALSTLVFFMSLYVVVNEWGSYVALFGIVVATIWSNKTKTNCEACA